MNLRLIAVLFSALAFVSGCSHVATYNPAYITGQTTDLQLSIDGKALVYTTTEDDAYIFSGHPTSFTGGGTTLELPLGKITREVAIAVFNKMFKGGVDTAQALPQTGDYRLIMRPRVTQFEYAYNQLKNAGFAITPQTRITLEVSLLNSQGQVLLQKQYDSGLRDGETYIVSGSPAETINQTVHVVLASLMKNAAWDASAILADQARAPTQ